MYLYNGSFAICAWSTLLVNNISNDSVILGWIIIIIGNFSLFNRQYFNYNLTRCFDFLPKSSLYIVYSIPCSCGKVYIGETTRRLEQRVKEHQDACKRGDEKVSVISEHLKREEVIVVDRASKNLELKIKEALHIQMTPHNKFNRGHRFRASNSQVPAKHLHLYSY